MEERETQAAVSWRFVETRRKWMLKLAFREAKVCDGFRLMRMMRKLASKATRQLRSDRAHAAIRKGCPERERHGTSKQFQT